MKLNCIKIFLFSFLDDETDPVLATVLNIPSVHVPTVLPSTASASGKKDKSVKQKPGKSLPSTKASHSRVSSPPPDTHVKQEEGKVREQILSN